MSLDQWKKHFKDMGDGLTRPHKNGMWKLDDNTGISRASRARKRSTAQSADEPSVKRPRQPTNRRQGETSIKAEPKSKSNQSVKRLQAKKNNIDTKIKTDPPRQRQDTQKNELKNQSKKGSKNNNNRKKKTLIKHKAKTIWAE